MNRRFASPSDQLNTPGCACTLGSFAPSTRRELHTPGFEPAWSFALFASWSKVMKTGRLRRPVAGPLVRRTGGWRKCRAFTLDQVSDFGGGDAVTGGHLPGPAGRTRSIATPRHSDRQLPRYDGAGKVGEGDVVNTSWGVRAMVSGADWPDTSVVSQLVVRWLDEVIGRD